MIAERADVGRRQREEVADVEQQRIAAIFADAMRRHETQDFRECERGGRDGDEAFSLIVAFDGDAHADGRGADCTLVGVLCETTDQLVVYSRRMSKTPVPSGAERRALFDELSAIFARCSEQATAIETQRDAALARIPEAQKLLIKRDVTVREAEQKADSAEQKADRLRAAGVEAADREFFETAQAADAKRQDAGIALDRRRETAVADASELFDQTIRAIHEAIAGLQAIADAERRAREERDKTVGKAEQAFRDDLRDADIVRQDALDAALGRQIAAHATADDVHSRAVADAQTEFTNAIAQAESALDDALGAMPAAKAIVDEARQELEALDRQCDEQKRAVEAKLRGDV